MKRADGLATTRTRRGRKPSAPEIKGRLVRLDPTIEQVKLFTVQPKGRSMPEATVVEWSDWLSVHERERSAHFVKASDGTEYPQIRVKRPTRLGEVHQSLMFALLRMAGSIRRDSQTFAEAESGPLIPRNAPHAGKKLVVDTGIGELAKAVGIGHGGNNRRIVYRALMDLREVEYRYKYIDGNSVVETDGERLMLFDVRDGLDVKAIISTRLTTLFLASETGWFEQYVGNDFVDRMSLPSGVDRLLHAWLSSRVRRGGQPRRFDLDAVVDGLWTSRYTAKQDMAGRRFLVRNALERIDGLEGWSVSESCGTVEVFRPTMEAVDG